METKLSRKLQRKSRQNEAVSRRMMLMTMENQSQRRNAPRRWRKMMIAKRIK
jgi:hypothetical protein